MLLRHSPNNVCYSRIVRSASIPNNIHITLVLLAYAFLVGIRVHDKSHLPANAPPEQAEPSPPLLSITTSEVRHLLARLFFPLPSQATLVQSWSWWRRQHQYWSSYYHTKQRLKAG